MKKVMSIGLVLALVLSLLSMTAVAAGNPAESGMYDVAAESAYSSVLTLAPQTADGTAVSGTSAEVDGAACTFYPGAEKLGVTFTGATNGSFYLFLVLNDDSAVPTAGNMVYIDQQIVASGSVSFTAYPSSLTSGTTYSLYLSSNAAGGGDIQTLTKVASFTYYAAFTLGDVNDDGIWDVEDALAVLRFSAHLAEPTEKERMAADVTKDSILDVEDALKILRYSAHLIETFDD